jgi:predicted DCC family thiol-disulfide oxidoreductase YuxK
MTPADPARTPLPGNSVAAEPIAAEPIAAEPISAEPISAEPIAADPVAADLPPAPLVLYDGDCGFCARSVQWILAHELDHDILFAPLQGPTAARARQRYPRIPQSIDSVVYIHGGRAHLRSKAMLHASSHMRPPWRWVYALRWFPAVILDLGYRVLAAVRYRIWGHADACRLVTPEQRRRFLP